MHRLNFALVITFVILSLSGCEQNKRTDIDNNTDADTTANNTLVSGTQYKITLDNNSLSPDTIRLSSGICYQLDFENNGDSEIEFIAGKNPSDEGFEDNLFEGLSVENIINDEEMETKGDQPLTGIKLKPGEKGSLAFTPDDNKKGEWAMTARTGTGSGNQNGVIIIN